MLNQENINNLCQKQKHLDSFIIENNNSTNVFAKNIFALKIELYEFINSLSAHKHWKKTPYNKDNACEELMDMLHFSLFALYSTNKTISQNEIKFNYKIIENEMNCKENDMFTLVLKIEKIVLDILKSEDFLKLVCFIDYINDKLFANDIFKSYDQKYQINIKRQTEKY